MIDIDHVTELCHVTHLVWGAELVRVGANAAACVWFQTSTQSTINHFFHRSWLAARLDGGGLAVGLAAS